MKQAIHKSSIPPSQIFVIRRLQEKYFDPVWHAHSEFQLFVVLEGTGTRFIGDSIKAFKPGEVIFTGPHLPHLWRSDDSYFNKKSLLVTDGIVIYFNENFLGDHIMEKEEMQVLKKMLAKSMRGLEFYGPASAQVVELMIQLTQLHGIESVIGLLQILEILAGSKQYHYISSIAYDGMLNEDETNRINMVYEYVMKNFKQKVSLEEVAELLHMTPTSFSRYFTMKNNKPFSKFISEIRIKHACKLIAESDDSIEHICYECGYNTLSNFNKQFKEVVGKQPLQYKKEINSL